MNVQLPQQSNLRYADEVSRSIEAELAAVADIDWYTTNVGRGNPQIYYNVTQQEEKATSFSFCTVGGRQLAYPQKEVIDLLRQRFNRFATARIEVKDFEQGPPIEAPIAIRIYGDQLDSLRAWSFRGGAASQAARHHLPQQSVEYPQNRLKVGHQSRQSPQFGCAYLRYRPNRTIGRGWLACGYPERRRRQRLPRGVGYATQRVAGRFGSIFGFACDQYAGHSPPAAAVGRLELESSPTRISHFNKRRFVQVTAYTRQGVLANDVLAGLVPELDRLNFPEGYGYQLAGEAESEGDAFGGGFATVILLTVFLFVAVLILQFRTFKGILIVLSVIPLGVIGGVTLLWLSGNPMSFIAILGFIGLAGIEVKNSILLVDFTNQLRSDGMPLQEAIEKAGELRFLPVVLTSLTAIGGLIPLAFNPNPRFRLWHWCSSGGSSAPPSYRALLRP